MWFMLSYLIVNWITPKHFEVGNNMKLNISTFVNKKNIDYKCLRFKKITWTTLLSVETGMEKCQLMWICCWLGGGTNCIRGAAGSHSQTAENIEPCGIDTWSQNIGLAVLLYYI